MMTEFAFVKFGIFRMMTAPIFLDIGYSLCCINQGSEVVEVSFPNYTIRQLVGYLPRVAVDVLV